MEKEENLKEVTLNIQRPGYFTLESSLYKKYLEEGLVPSELKEKFEEEGYELDEKAELFRENNRWWITDRTEDKYIIIEDEKELKVSSVVSGTLVLTSEVNVKRIKTKISEDITTLNPDEMMIYLNNEVLSDEDQIYDRVDEGEKLLIVLKPKISVA